MSRAGILIAYIFGSCLLGCLAAYPVYRVLGADFDSVVSRSILAFAVILFYPTCKALNHNILESLGFPSTGRTNVIIKAWLIGIASLIPISLFFLLCDYRAWNPFYSHELLSLLMTIFSAIVSGLIIGIIEESFFRGLLQTELTNILNTTSSIIIVCLIYSSVHFLELPEGFSTQSIQWNSGFTFLLSSFSAFSQPSLIWDSWIALFAAGLFLSIVRLRTNNILWCIGIHAGWVAHIKIIKAFTDRNNEAACSSLTGSYDKYIGELSTAWVILLLVAWVMYRSRALNH